MFIPAAIITEKTGETPLGFDAPIFFPNMPPEQDNKPQAPKVPAQKD